jgi:signal recognition particle subunit SRP68
MFHRCLTIGRYHAVAGEFRNALALYSRSLDLSSNAIAMNSATSTEAIDGPPKLDIASVELKTFRQYVDGMVLQYRALVELKALMDQQKTSTKDIYRPPLVERLQEYPIEDIDLSKVVDFPPKLQAIPVKPLFFDLAWNYIDYPGRAALEVNGTPPASKTASEEKKEPAKKSWFGFGR